MKSITRGPSGVHYHKAKITGQEAKNRLAVLRRSKKDSIKKRELAIAAAKFVEHNKIKPVARIPEQDEVTISNLAIDLANIAFKCKTDFDLEVKKVLQQAETRLARHITYYESLRDETQWLRDKMKEEKKELVAMQNAINPTKKAA